MEGYMYATSLVIIGLLALMFFRNNNTLLLLISLLIGVYIIYSHETGHTATEFKNKAVNSINKEAEGFNERRGIEKYDEKKLQKSVK